MKRGRAETGGTGGAGGWINWRLALGLVACLVALAAPATAQRAIEIPNFDARIVVSKDGSIEVTETITANFVGSWNGIYRKVPVIYRTPQGFNWTIRLTLLHTSDDQGNPLRTETLREGHFVNYKLWVPGAQDAEKTVVLRYRAENALRFFEHHDELYWNVTGDEWDVALGMVSSEIVLPDGATGLRATAFNGPYGATQREAEVAMSGTTVSVRMPRPLEFREGVTAVVGWDKGLVAEPTAADRASGVLAANWPIALPFLVLAGMLMIWWRRGRDPRRLPVVVQYEPPEGLTPAEAGTLTDEKVDMRDITATLIDLAVRGYVRIEEREEPAVFGLLSNEEFVFHRLKSEAEWATLARHEGRVLEGIFKDSADEVKLSDLKNEFYKELDGIRDAVMDRLMGRKLFRTRPDSTKTGWTVAGLGLFFVFPFLGVILSSRLMMTPAPFFAAGIASGLIVIVFGRYMPARTVSGARAVEKALGFGEFLQRVDGKRFEAIEKTPEMFERFLPYAMAFGVEQKWAKGFRDIYTTPPNWYAGRNFTSFNAGSFSRSLSSMSTRAASTMSSSPRSSSGSGFSGGSSGGGGGGGGGGGF
ncbi:MAG: DUF2207 domain-containing protein [Gemmatimonadales bacterium]